MKPINVAFDGYLITSDKTKLKPEQIHHWLSTESYWSKNIPFQTVKTAFDHSFCIGILKEDEQIGYARVITDFATFGYLADVYVTEPHRGKGLGKKLMECIMAEDWMKGLRKTLLATLDAHELYRPFGFVPPVEPARYLEINRFQLYDTPKVQ